MDIVKAVVIGLLLGTSGCATNYASKSPDEVAKAAITRDSEFDHSGNKKGQKPSNLWALRPYSDFLGL